MSTFSRGFAVLATGAFVGKFVAIVREVVFASAFGTGSVATGFRVAQTASMVPANLISGDLLSAAFAPSYAREVRDNPNRASSMLLGYAIWLSTILSFTALLVFYYRHQIVLLIVPGAEGTVGEQASSFLGILSISIPLYGISAVFAYALGVHGFYLLTSVRPIIQSVALLIGTLLAVATHWMLWLAIGFLAAWAGYAVWCYIELLRRGLTRRPTWPDITQGWRFVLHGARGIAPLFILPVFMQLSIVLERVFASYGPNGLVAAVDYARTISDSVMSLIAMPLGILGLTQLATMTSERYDFAIRRMSIIVLLLTFPVSAFLFVGAEAIIGFVYVRGDFGIQDQYLTSGVLVGLASGLAFQALGYCLSRALTAKGKNRTVLGFTLLGLACQIVVQSLGVSAWGGVAIGLGASVSGVILTLGCAYSLGLLGTIWRIILLISPSIAGTSVIIIIQLPLLWTLLVLSVLWTLNFLLVPNLRASVIEVFYMVFGRFLRKITEFPL